MSHATAPVSIKFQLESMFPSGNPIYTLALADRPDQAPLPNWGPKQAIRERFAYLEIAPVAIICEPSVPGWARTQLMIATQPPGGSVFLVEDEVMIRMMVADMLEELGYSVAAEAGEISEAIRLVQSTEFDFAILDVNVNGKVISPVADLIKARNRPFIFATGYGSSGLPEEYRDRPALQKPFQLETLARMIESALKSATV